MLQQGCNLGHTERRSKRSLPPGQDARQHAGGELARVAHDFLAKCRDPECLDDRFRARRHHQRFPDRCIEAQHPRVAEENVGTFLDSRDGAGEAEGRRVRVIDDQRSRSQALGIEHLGDADRG